MWVGMAIAASLCTVISLQAYRSRYKRHMKQAMGRQGMSGEDADPPAGKTRG